MVIDDQLKTVFRVAREAEIDMYPVIDSCRAVMLYLGERLLARHRYSAGSAVWVIPRFEAKELSLVKRRCP